MSQEDNVAAQGTPLRDRAPSATGYDPVMLVLAPNEWDGPWMNRQQLFSRVGRKYRVLYSTGVPFRGRRKEPAGHLLSGSSHRVDNVHLDYLPPWLVKPGNSRRLQGVADRVAAWRWRRRLATLGRGPQVAYVFHPKFWPVVRHLKPARLVYHAYDLYHLQASNWHEWDAHERALVSRADLVVASSAPIAEYLAGRGARNVRVLENAADYDAFAGAALAAGPEPEVLSGICRPRVGYTGALNRKVDFPLLLDLAARLPEVQFVLIGRSGNLGAVNASAVAALGALRNVHFLGFHPPPHLPGLIAAMDVNVMAYKLGPGVWTEGIYPLKLHEYLATGRPVISADLSTVRPFQDVVRIASSPDEWERAIREALGGLAVGTPDARRLRARQNTWDVRAEQLSKWLEALGAIDSTAALATPVSAHEAPTTHSGRTRSP